MAKAARVRKIRLSKLDFPDCSEPKRKHRRVDTLNIRENPLPVGAVNAERGVVEDAFSRIQAAFSKV